MRRPQIDKKGRAVSWTFSEVCEWAGSLQEGVEREVSLEPTLGLIPSCATCPQALRVWTIYKVSFMDSLSELFYHVPDI